MNAPPGRIVHWLQLGWGRQMIGWLLVLLLAGVATWALRDRPIEVRLLSASQSQAQTQAQLFHSRNTTFSEAQSIRFDSPPDGRPTWLTARIEGNRPPRWIRFDPPSPGITRLIGIEFSNGSRSERLEGQRLHDQLRVLHDVEIEQDGEDAVLFAVGHDPALMFAVPDAVRRSPPERTGIAAALGAILLLVGGTLALAARSSLRAGRPPPLPAILMLLSAAAFVLLLAALGIEPALRPIATMRYGLPLLLGALGFALVGAAFDLRAGGDRARLFLWLLLGQVVVMAYLQLRSLVTAWLGIPITRVELLALPLGAAWMLARRSHQLSRPLVMPDRWLWCQIGLLAAVCLLVADRELPRLAMLSSDPDQHAFFALQFQRLGGLPWEQAAWGSEPFNYPGGTSLLGAAWAWLSGLDTRNVATALPWILYFCGALAMADVTTERLRSTAMRALVSFTSAGLMAAGFMLPLYRHFVHQEGLGRILGFGFLALVAAAVFQPGRPFATRFAAVALGVFAIASLNPINVIGCTVLLGAVALRGALCRDRDTALILALPAGLLLVAADPFYFALLTGAGHGTGVSLGTGFAPVSLGDGVRRGLSALLAAPWHHLRDALGLLPSAGWLVWLLPVALSLLALALTPTCPRPKWQTLTAVAAAVAVMACTGAVAAQFVGDPGLYLLAAYQNASFAQLRIVCALALACLAVATVVRHTPRGYALGSALALLLVASVLVAGRDPQPWKLEPKWDYCGGLVCPHPDDVAVLEAFSDLYANDPAAFGNGLARLLTVNAVRDLGKERWLMPVGGARLAPFLDLPPSAFFYFQGEAAFTTENYDRHVCQTFDREWLTRHRIAFVFLPADRAHGCIADADALIASEDVLLRRGEAYVLRLTPTTRTSIIPK